MRVQHLGMSGLRVSLAGRTLAIDPPQPVSEAVVVTWSERERVAGARAAATVAAHPDLLTWLGADGIALVDGGEVEVDGVRVRAVSFPPIPYATPAEAARKTASALSNPLRALRRLAHTVRRPATLPYAVELERDGLRVVCLQQALHRFLPSADLDRLVAAFAGADVAIAGTDFDDEASTGGLLARFGAGTCVIADLIGPVRRALGLPVRPLSVALAAAPPGTLALEVGGRLSFTPLERPER